jgi:hypothetical protein
MNSTKVKLFLRYLIIVLIPIFVLLLMGREESSSWKGTTIASGSTVTSVMPKRTPSGRRAHGSRNALGDPFALHMENSPSLKALYLDAEKDDGYIRDQSVFGDGISIEDTMAVLVRYESGYVSASGEPTLEGISKERSIKVRPHFAPPFEVEIPVGEGGHGGGDPALLNDLFGARAPDPLNRAASHLDGAWSILTGIAANRSIRTGSPVDVEGLIGTTDGIRP